jgi:hypothetical protein
VPHWNPPPQLVHAILPATGVGVGDGVAVGPLREHALIARIEVISKAVNRGLTKRVYRADELGLGHAAGLGVHGASGKPHLSRSWLTRRADSCSCCRSMRPDLTAT